jgi:DNA-binding CsgD family transcriptional regulator
MDVNDRPGWCQKVADTNLVTVVLEASTAEDVQARMNHEDADRWRLRKAIRLCRQAYEQGGLLTIYDLSEILNYSDSMIARLIKKHEYKSKKLVPRRGTIHDAGNAISHKWIICHKRYVEGKSADQIARETYHSLDAVDRYLGQFDRVRHCLQQGMDTNEIAHILNCGVSLVEVYRAIDTELSNKK